MRPLLLLLAGCGGKPADTAGSPDFDYPLDATLRITDGQLVGTHNSYHIEPSDPLVDEWKYTHAPLETQLSEQGVRQLELDIHYLWDDHSFGVYHIPNVDDQSTCPRLVDCLDTIATWSGANPGHFPLLVMIEPKDDVDEDKISGHYDELDAFLRDGIPADQRFSPDDLQGDYGSVGDAVRAEGWPTLGALRGKVLFGLLDSGEGRAEYTEDGTSLAGRAMFSLSETVDDDLAALFGLDSPVGEADAIAAAVAGGFLVRTYPDNEDASWEAGLATGAQYLSTDYPAAVDGVEFVAEIPEGSPGRCNPVTAPEGCTAADVEDPAQLTWP